MDFKTALGSRRSICLLLLMATVAAILLNFKLLLSLEYRAFDMLSRFRHRESGIAVIIVAIDDTSLKEMGDWPWPRSYIADVIDTLSASGAQTIGISILYRDEELNDGLVAIQNLKETIRKKPLIGQKRTLNKIDQLLSETLRQLDHDKRLIAVRQPFK
ncbi:MAG: CHASE2 domain-containing protein [Desulfobacterales bacterium]